MTPSLPGEGASYQKGSVLDKAARHDALVTLVEEYADHQSVRCGWPKGYKQWVDGDCACGLTESLRDAGLPVEWAGKPPED